MSTTFSWIQAGLKGKDRRPEKTSCKAGESKQKEVDQKANRLQDAFPGLTLSSHKVT